MLNEVTNCYKCENPINEWENRVANLSDHSYFIIPKYSECHTSCYLELCLFDSLQKNSVYATCKKCDELLVKMLSKQHKDDYYHLGCWGNEKRREFLNDPKNKEIDKR